MSGEQPSEGGGYTEVQAGPPAHAPAPPLPAVRTLHNPFFVTGLVGGDEQTPSSVPSSVPWPSQPTAAEDTASSQCPLLSFYPEPTDGTDSMLPARSFDQNPPTHTPMFSFGAGVFGTARDCFSRYGALTSGLRVGAASVGTLPFASSHSPPTLAEDPAAQAVPVLLAYSVRRMAQGILLVSLHCATSHHASSLQCTHIKRSMAGTSCDLHQT